MTATITATNGAGSTIALLTLSPYEAVWESRNVVVDLLGGGIAIAVVMPRPSSGTLEFLYQTEAEARAGALLHSEEASFVLDDTDRPGVNIEYVVQDGGTVRLRLDQDTLVLWILSVDYQEV